ncbi:MAG TPA: aminodeoxychorismate synthase component I [Steroidobacteraceae bacterium]|nr:aminodeoxychorismate synthase component I [Steroidobacteraceae bacterium]
MESAYVRAPLITQVPVSGRALRSLASNHAARYPVFFDSAAEGPLARYSMLACEPRAVLLRNAGGILRAQGWGTLAGGFLDNLEAWYRSESGSAGAHSAPKPLPFLGGWIVYLGYEVAAEIEPRLRLPAADAPCSAFALRVANFAVYDVAANCVYAVSEDADAVAHARLIADLEAADETPPVVEQRPLKLAALEEEPEELFLARVRAAQEYIAAGDIYQANLSRRWRLKLRDGVDAAQVYDALRLSNPAPFAARVQVDGMSIFSSSPERLLRICGREISTRPIAGTRARHGSAEQDRRDTAELVAHPKERAEHIMLIDLERNDLGRVCEAGSIKVDEYMVTETYAHVHHIVSNVRGRLRADRSPVDALRALFPGGTITGCPKVRCMEIIAALEGEGRGAYTGSLGWLDTDGDADFNILIRTLTMRGADIELRAGAGIVADSIPVRELEETRAKARGLLRAFDNSPGESGR